MLFRYCKCQIVNYICGENIIAQHLLCVVSATCDQCPEAQRKGNHSRCRHPDARVALQNDASADMSHSNP